MGQQVSLGEPGTMKRPHHGSPLKNGQQSLGFTVDIQFLIVSLHITLGKQPCGNVQLDHDFDKMDA